jgi:hypothetical protein
MAMTLRLPPALNLQASQLAAELGVSVNGLVALALRDYIDARSLRRMPSSAGPSESGGPGAISRGGASAPQAARDPKDRSQPSIKPPGGNRNAPCPCGALNAQGYPIKWKHCHGAASTQP